MTSLNRSQRCGFGTVHPDENLGARLTFGEPARRGFRPAPRVVRQAAAQAGATPADGEGRPRGSHRASITVPSESRPAMTCDSMDG